MEAIYPNEMLGLLPRFLRVCAGFVKSIRHANMGIFTRFEIMFLLSYFYLSLPIAATQHQDIFKEKSWVQGYFLNPLVYLVF